jgi:hypothetical protein
MCYWVEYTEIVAQGTDLAAMSLIIGAVFSLFVLICVNGLLARVAPRWKFSQAELMFVYIMQTVSIGISGIGMMQFLITTLGNAFYFDNAPRLEGPFSPRHSAPSDPELRGRPAGHAEVLPGQLPALTDVLSAWAGPIFWWSAFICVLLGSMLCLNVILRRQWTDNESSPSRSSICRWRSPATTQKPAPSSATACFWAAFLIPVVLESLASLNYLYPNVPAIPLKPSTLPNLSSESRRPPGARSAAA